MTEIADKCGDPRVDVCALAKRIDERVDREGMPEIVLKPMSA